MKSNAQIILKKISISFLLLLVSLECCFGQTDTNLIAAGDWSETVRDGEGFSGGLFALRGRLLVYDDSSSNALNHARVYLELQHVHVSNSAWDPPVGVYFEFATNNDLHFDLRDKFGKTVPEVPVATWGPVPDPYWVTLPYESTLRLRVDMLLGPDSKPNGLEILVPSGCWIIRPNASDDFFLSATFTAPQGHPSPLSPQYYHVWKGALNLPPVKISAKICRRNEIKSATSITIFLQTFDPRLTTGGR